MLTNFDDYLIHQTIDTIDHVATGDPRFQDRGLFFVHGKDGEFLLEIGFGLYPNQNMIDAWVAGTLPDAQYNIRVARPLQHDRTDLNIGPLHIDIVRPMSEWTVRLDDNEHGLRCDLRFHARTPAFEYQPVFVRRDNFVEHHQMHLQQGGTYEGWLEIGGRRYDTGLIGSRDRSWGVRGPQAGQPYDRKRQAPASVGERAKSAAVDHSRMVWIAAEFEDYSLQAWLSTNQAGRTIIADGSVISARDGSIASRMVDWDKPTVQLGDDGFPQSLEMMILNEAGEKDRLLASPYLSRNPAGNGYYKGFYGVKRPALHVEGETWNTADPEFRKANGHMNGTMLARFEHKGNIGHGILITSLLEHAI